LFSDAAAAVHNIAEQNAATGMDVDAEAKTDGTELISFS